MDGRCLALFVVVAVVVVCYATVDEHSVVVADENVSLQALAVCFITSVWCELSYCANCTYA